jgi:hypothetical protein
MGAAVMQIANGAWAVLRGFGRCCRIGLLAFVLVPLWLVSSPLTLSEEGNSKEADPFFRQRGIDDRAAFFLGAISSRAETTARVDSDLGIGSTLLLERLFSLPRSQDYLRFQGYYRFARRHRLDFRYMRVSAEGTNTLLDEEITVGNETFQFGAAIGARNDTRLGVLDYRYAFVNNGRAEAGLSAGLGIIDVDLEIFGEISVAPGPILTASERITETIPLPVAGVYTDFTLTRRLFLSVEGLLFTANYDKYSGEVGDVRVALRWYPVKLFGFGVAYNRTRIDVDIELDGGTVSLDYSLEGPSVFVTFLVGGLK